MPQSLFTGQTPASQDLTDGIVLMLGTYMVPAVAGTVTALRFRFPETVQDPVKAALFRTSDMAKLTPVSDPVFSSPTLDDWNEVTLASPVVVEADEEYCAAVRIIRYCASTGIFPLTNGDLTAPADAGRYSTADPDGSVTFPNNISADSCYFVDLVFEAAVPAQGTADVGLGLAVATAGARLSQGSAAAGLGLEMTASGGRLSTGAAAAGLDLALASTGGRAAEGALALGLNLAVVVRGSNGEAGRPVATFPWTPRPVRSFSEVQS